MVLAELGQQLRGPGVQRGGILARQGILIFGGRLAAADVQILNRLQEQAGTGNLIELRPQALDHLVGGQLALRQGLERDVDIRGIQGTGAREPDDRGDRRVRLHDGLKLLQLLPHRLERECSDQGRSDPLRSPNILFRKQRGGEKSQHEQVEQDHHDEQYADEQRMIEHLGERARVSGLEALELPLRPYRPPRFQAAAIRGSTAVVTHGGSEQVVARTSSE